MIGFRPRFVEAGQPINPRGSFALPALKRNLLLVTKGAVHHRDTLSAFFKARYSALRSEIDNVFTGEDLLMSFVQALEFDASVKLVCLGHKDHCSATCEENNVRALDKRHGGKARYDLLQKFFSTLGSPLVQLQGNSTAHYPLPTRAEHERCGEERWQSWCNVARLHTNESVRPPGDITFARGPHAPRGSAARPIVSPK